MKLTRKQWMMLVVLVLGAFVTVLNQTLVTPALPSIMTEMNVDQSTAQWLTTGFTLVNAIMIPITAFLTDRMSFLPIALAITTLAPSAIPINKFRISPISGLFAPTAATAPACPTVPANWRA